MLERLIQDIRYSWRTLLKSPGFTLVALLTLANSSIFSVINAALLKELPCPKPDQLVLLFERAVVKEGGGPGPAALANFLGMRGAAWATQFLRSLLFGISAKDPVTFIAVPLLLLAVALAACAIPAWRATQVDPATALRSE
jgi:ABC-type lipoprotein release transport system permease subunit